MADPPPLRAGLCDAALLAALHAECFEASGGEVWSQTAMTDLLRMPGSFAFIATRQGVEPVGLLIGRTAGADSEILTIGVLPKHRRAGHGRSLVAAAARHAGDQGAEALFLEVAADNTAAAALYRQCGFREVGRRRDYYRRGSETVDAILFRQDLE